MTASRFLEPRHYGSQAKRIVVAVETRQMTYVTDSSDKLFLGREACVQLGIISNMFPDVQPSRTGTTAVHGENTAPCGCPERQSPPPSQSVLPFPLREENRSKLQEYLLDYYRSTPVFASNGGPNHEAYGGSKC
jgi:hypothetical protein